MLHAKSSKMSLYVFLRLCERTNNKHYQFLTIVITKQSHLSLRCESSIKSAIALTNLLPKEFGNVSCSIHCRWDLLVLPVSHTFSLICKIRTKFDRSSFFPSLLICLQCYLTIWVAQVYLNSCQNQVRASFLLI